MHQHVVASQRHNCVNFGVVHIFGHAMEQVLVQLQQLGPLVAHAMRRRQFAHVGADPHGAEGGLEEEHRHLIAPGFHLKHVGVKPQVVGNAPAALCQRRFEIKQRNTDVNALLQRYCARDAVNGHAFIGQRNVRTQADDDVLELLYFVGVGVVDKVAELNNVRPLRGVHALAVLGGESGGFGVKYDDLHFIGVDWR